MEMILRPLSRNVFKCFHNSILKRCYVVHSEIQSQCDNAEEPKPTTKLLTVSIIGTPNAGKSTIINKLMDRKVCPASVKVHTTRTKATAVFTEGESQIVFLDTPGLVNDKERKKFQLEESFLTDVRRTLKTADVIGVMHDAVNVYTREMLDIKVIRLLEYYKHKPSFLILNKIDELKSKRKLLDVIRLVTDNCVDGQPIPGQPAIQKDDKQTAGKKDLKSWKFFNAIFMVSALTGDGLDDVKKYLIDKAKPAEWLYPSEVFTDKTPEELIESTVKAQLLNFLPQEMPYVTKSQIEYFDLTDKGEIYTSVILQTPSERHSKFIAGENNGKLRLILRAVQEDLQSAFKVPVRISIVFEPPVPTNS